MTVGELFVLAGSEIIKETATVDPSAIEKITEYMVGKNTLIMVRDAFSYPLPSLIYKETSVDYSIRAFFSKAIKIALYPQTNRVMVVTLHAAISFVIVPTFKDEFSDISIKDTVENLESWLKCCEKKEEEAMINLGKAIEEIENTKNLIKKVKEDT